MLWIYYLRDSNACANVTTLSRNVFTIYKIKTKVTAEVTRSNAYLSGVEAYNNKLAQSLDVDWIHKQNVKINRLVLNVKEYVLNRAIKL